jgi:hypothetical protein
MGRKSLSLVAAVCFTGLCAAVAFAQDAAQFAGAWKGKWQGDGVGGRFELTLVKQQDGKLGGGVSVGEEAGDYKADFTSVELAGDELRARYTYTPNGQADIVITAKRKDDGLTGTWAMVTKGADAGQAFANGIWDVKK